MDVKLPKKKSKTTCFNIQKHITSNNNFIGDTQKEKINFADDIIIESLENNQNNNADIKSIITEKYYTIIYDNEW